MYIIFVMFVMHHMGAHCLIEFRSTFGYKEEISYTSDSGKPLRRA